MKRGFTLLEVLVSVSLLFVVGMALTEVSTKNLQSIEVYHNTHDMLSSLVLHNNNHYRHINDYSGFQGVSTWDIVAHKNIKFDREIIYQMGDDFRDQMSITIERITINLDGQDSLFYRFR
jgi:prepilin-type N-terminal cleavage/methylation domain-containing protein